MHVWMALDPQTYRVMVQGREFADGDFPGGLRGANWPRREGTVDPAVWESLLEGALSPEDQDALHRDLWTGSGDTPWPT